MIIINRPELESLAEMSCLKSRITDDQNNLDEVVYYSVPIEYHSYVVYEKADVFVMAMLMPALFSGSDIYVDGIISRNLYYSLHNGLIYILSHTFKCKPIQIFAKEVVDIEFQGEAVGAGCSLGVDSFATIYQHLLEDKEGYGVTHLALFNVCEFGFEDLEHAHALFMSDYERTLKFAKEIGCPLLWVESNITVVLNRYGVGLFDCCTLVQASAAFVLEKLFKIYLHASGYLLDKIEYITKSLEHFDFVLFGLLSNSNFRIISTLTTMQRTERTEMIADDKYVRKYLHVCWRNNQVEGIHNCGRCAKCVRTLMTLDILGKMENYGDIFDFTYYTTHRNKEFGKVIGFRSINPFFKDIYHFCKQKHYKIPWQAKLISIIYFALLPPFWIYQHLPEPIYKSIKKILKKLNYFGV